MEKIDHTHWSILQLTFDTVMMWFLEMAKLSLNLHEKTSTNADRYGIDVSFREGLSLILTFWDINQGNNRSLRNTSVILSSGPLFSLTLQPYMKTFCFRLCPWRSQYTTIWNIYDGLMIWKHHLHPLLCEGNPLVKGGFPSQMVSHVCCDREGHSIRRLEMYMIYETEQMCIYHVPRIG